MLAHPNLFKLYYKQTKGNIIFANMLKFCKQLKGPVEFIFATKYYIV